MHILIGGPPSSGKTTLIEKLLPYFKNSKGFFTRQIREGSRRKGFELVTLEGEVYRFAHEDLKSSFRVSRYGVDLEVLEKVIRGLSKEIGKTEWMVIDEIGKMECKLSLFKEFISEVLNSSQKLLATISDSQDEYLRSIKNRSHVFLVSLGEPDEDIIFERILLAKDALSLEKVKGLEEKARKVLGISEAVLVENAARNLIEIWENFLRQYKKILVLSGRGNNGADSLALARHFINRKLKPRVYLVDLESRGLTSQRQEQLQILEKIFPSGIKNLSSMKDVKVLSSVLKESDLVIDGIFGIGFKPPLFDSYKELFSLVNKYSSCVLSIDIPSGLSKDGFLDEVGIEADFTVTFIAPKEALFLGKGPEHSGKIFVKDIGVSRDVLEKL